MTRIRKIILILGGACLVLAAQQYSIGNESMTWSGTEGVITVSTIKTTTTASEYSSKVYEPYIEYIFHSEGKDYIGHRITLGNKSFSKKSLVKNIIDKYPKGKKVVVYHELLNPKNSVLERGVDSVFILLLAGAGIFLILWGVLFNKINKTLAKWIMH